MTARRTPPGSVWSRLPRLARRALVGVGVVGLAALAVWLRTLPLERIVVVGAHAVATADLAERTEAQPGAVALYSLSPALMADRVQRHPWVREARVWRLPTGTLRISVTERTPVALALGPDGAPSHFFDAEGHAMPVVTLRPPVVDVPVLSGAVDAPPAGERTPLRPLRELLAAFARADAATLALVSEVHVGERGVLTAWTTPAGAHPTLPVRLGRTGHAEQLARLRAFYDQAVLPRSTARIRHVDLRFAGQVVTREDTPPVAPPRPAAAASDSLVATDSIL